MSLIDDAIPLRKLDDLGLMRKFFAGEGTLLSNQNLRAESSFNNELQLLAKREGIVATLKLEKPAIAMIREQSSYRMVLHQALEDNGFVLISAVDNKGFVQYQKYNVPDGYKVNCTEARYLWREWWMMYKSTSRVQSPLQMNLLVLVREQWYPIREMVSSQGMLYIKTLVKEIVLDGSSQIAWLNQRKDTSTSPSAEQLQGVTAEINHDDVTQIEPPDFSTSTSSDFSSRRLHPALASRQIPRRSSSQGVVDQASVPRKETAKSPSVSNDDVWSDPRMRRQEQPAEWQKKPLSEPDPQPVAVQLPAQPNRDSFPDVSAVLKFRDGRIYVTTTMGELVIEGTDLKFWLNPNNR